MADKIVHKPGFLNRRLILGTTIAGAVVFFIVGIIFWGGFNTAMEATNTLEFCVGCHEMEANVYQEYTPTIHYSNRTGVRAGCPDCHVPRPWIHKMVRKIQASKEVFSWLTGKIDTKEEFEEHRFTMAKSVWKAMKETDSRECRNCHNFESMNPEHQKPRARKQHLNAFKEGQTCIDCHKGIAHNDVRHMLSDEELEEIEKPNPDYIREIPQMYKDGLARVEAKEAEEAEQERIAKAELKAKQQKQVEGAVAEALEAYKAEQALLAETKAAATAGAKGEKAAKPVVKKAAKASGIKVNWSKADSRDITIFYPGQASIEWILNGRDHGGARPFTKGGDRCVTCHDKETADMGAKIVSGEKAEATPIPGKRGSIPVTVDATYDNENLYMRFSWAEGEHAPVPFADGGKLDPENPMKLAIMFATDEVEFADRAGCWGTCHHDAKNMPDAPDADTLATSEFAKQINIGDGVTKYLKESRTKLEVKGRRGKKRGGWDKLKSADEIAADTNAGKFMDLIRYKSGKGEVEDGHIMEQRTMHGGQISEFDAKLKNGTWTVVMKRKLKSDKAGDITLEKGKTYNFGFAIHDDYSNSRFHHVSLGYKLGIDNGDGDINAAKQ
ncbi:NapC/NirT family cytochrome c [Litoribacillus peritrichatus]|uniref:Cytochrome c-552/DMSO reductase-like haem-binding domain-containing protein n=1 Tax=Litoribacillus peritrichatus TaxID=718191 RepID=A0ABP7M9P2_9GAMM